MLNRHVVSLSQPLRTNLWRYYRVMPKNNNNDQGYNTNEIKYNTNVYETKELTNHIKNQEIQLNKITDELTNQAKVIENINKKINEISTDNQDIFGVSLINMVITYLILFKL